MWVKQVDFKDSNLNSEAPFKDCYGVYPITPSAHKTNRSDVDFNHCSLFRALCQISYRTCETIASCTGDRQIKTLYRFTVCPEMWDVIPPSLSIIHVLPCYTRVSGCRIIWLAKLEHTVKESNLRQLKRILDYRIRSQHAVA